MQTIIPYINYFFFFSSYHWFKQWQPSAYAVNRPYFIPVYGPAGQIPLYFPPQPFSHNVGMPPDNPISFMGPPYLPPRHTTMKPQKSTTMTIENRYPNFDDDDEPRPIWGGSLQTSRPRTTTRRPRPQQIPARPQQAPVRPVNPTRPPRPKTTTETPSLIHDINAGKIPLNALDESKETEAAIENIFGNADDYNPMLSRPFKESKPQAGSSFNSRKTISPPRTTTVPTSTTTIKEDPSNCVWAVVSCCSAVSTNVAEACFEQRGCPGPFWDRSPCESDFAKAAINKALEYYGK